MTEIITASSTDADIRDVAELLWPYLCDIGEVEAASAQAAIVAVAGALRTLLQAGETPAVAVRYIGTLAVFMSGAKGEIYQGASFVARLK